MAATRDTARAATLLVAYSLGLGVPFLVVGLGLGRLTGPLDWVRRHSRTITLVSAVILAVFGVLLLLNRFELLTARLQDALTAVGLKRLVTLG